MSMGVKAVAGDGRCMTLDELTTFVAAAHAAELPKNATIHVRVKGWGSRLGEVETGPPTGNRPL